MLSAPHEVAQILSARQSGGSSASSSPICRRDAAPPNKENLRVEQEFTPGLPRSAESGRMATIRKRRGLGLAEYASCVSISAACRRDCAADHVHLRATAEE